MTIEKQAHAQLFLTGDIILFLNYSSYSNEMKLPVVYSVLTSEANA